MRGSILIVEDHGGVRVLLRDWLSAVFPGSRFLEADCGEEAVALARAETPDVVLMDLRLPKMDGLEATRLIKADSPQIKVVMLTIHDAVEYRRDAEAAGASAYVLKTRSHTELIPAVAELLPKKATPARGGTGDRDHAAAYNEPVGDGERDLLTPVDP